MAEIYMIGCSHEDERGAIVLKDVLERVSPDLILNEASAIVAAEQELVKECMKTVFAKRHVNPTVVAKYLKMQAMVGYETRVSRSYASRNDVAQDFLNDMVVQQGRDFFKALAECQVSSLKKDSWSVFAGMDRSIGLNKEMLRRFAADVGVRLGRDDEEEKFRLIEAGLFGTSGLDDPRIVGDRDAVMEGTLRGKNKELDQTAIIVTVTGIGHLIRDRLGRTFYSRIKDLNPKRVFLADSVICDF